MNVIQDLTPERLKIETEWHTALEATARKLRDANPDCPAVDRYWRNEVGMLAALVAQVGK